MPRDFSRAARIADQIQRDLSDLIRKELKDPRVALVTITGVELPREPAPAKSYITPLAGVESGERSSQALQHAAGFLRPQPSHTLQVRSTPPVHFAYGVSVGWGARLTQR